MNFNEVKANSLILVQYPHSGDRHLWLCLRQNKPYEYVIHTYNEQDKGFHNGHYFTAFSFGSEADVKAVEKRARVEFHRKVLNLYKGVAEDVEESAQ